MKSFITLAILFSTSISMAAQYDCTGFNRKVSFSIVDLTPQYAGVIYKGFDWTLERDKGSYRGNDERLENSNFFITIPDHQNDRNFYLDLSIPQGLFSIDPRTPFQVVLTETLVDEKIYTTKVKASCVYTDAARSKEPIVRE